MKKMKKSLHVKKQKWTWSKSYAELHLTLKEAEKDYLGNKVIEWLKEKVKSTFEKYSRGSQLQEIEYDARQSKKTDEDDEEAKHGGKEKENDGKAFDATYFVVENVGGSSVQKKECNNRD
ncbi:hypothetical protein L6452_43705 [Arctium lappa]|uniref:Uncharacterized protein n=1 Tax=Arctium lappa TaxID=4217 RepID=A0ACB8XDT2_ARCLA|nr:hypothetical protein L6452_43705 [Arctium lappa]